MTEPAPGTVPALDPAVNPITNFIKNEPVMVGYGVTWALANVGEFIIGHTHLVDASQWNSVTTTLAPIITTAVLGGLAWVTRKFVSPVVKKVENL